MSELAGNKSMILIYIEQPRKKICLQKFILKYCTFNDTSDIEKHHPVDSDVQYLDR